MTVHYTLMDGPELLSAVGVDASKWATAFRQHAKSVEGRGEDPLEEGFLLAWFANAMMAMHDHIRPECAPVVLPDGSAFFTAEIH